MTKTQLEKFLLRKMPLERKMLRANVPAPLVLIFDAKNSEKNLFPAPFLAGI
jgi:hypothetical protein